MYFHVNPFLVILSLSIPGLAVDTPQSLPSCAVPCLLNAIYSSPCPATNQTCLCNDSILQANATACVLQQCTIKDSLVARNVSESACQRPIRDEGHILVVTTTVLALISNSLVILRLGYKLHNAYVNKLRNPFASDDWLILLVVIVGAASNTIQIHGVVPNGMGRDVWTLTPSMITKFGQLFYFMEISYFFENTVTKLSITMFYLRVFPNRGVRHILWATLAITALTGAIYIVVTIFQCTPIDYLWLKWDGEHQGTCLNLNALAWSNAAVSIILDVWMLAVPLSQLRHISLDWRRKLGVGLMFGVGALVTVVSIVRLRTLVIFSNSLNPTWDNLATALWSSIEIATGVICTCMPSLRLILVKVFPMLRGGSTNRSRGHHSTSTKLSDHNDQEIPLTGQSSRPTKGTHPNLNAVRGV
ncbi:putative PTH11-type G-protein coupled receptor protein [Thozetella sp. PMI_491]|nr:putative PTH11-type G-protein coupled receptor protein [Thozetella sp. PMI_491]